jgi:membrane protease YdiL (CAAX protease family)
LFICGLALGAHGGPESVQHLARIPKYIVSAVAVAIIEEGFFRAYLMGGMIEDFGLAAALLISSAVYSVTHLLRAPAHFYVQNLRPLAGLADLAASTGRLSHPAMAIPALIGLFALGMLLGEAFLLTGNVYLPMGLHAGVVIGAKLWPVMLTPGVRMPHWLAGNPHYPLISGFGAWMLTLALMALLPVVFRRRLYST